VRIINIILTVCLIAAVSGCQSNEKIAFQEKIIKLEQKQLELKSQFEQSSLENEQLKNQINTIHNLKTDISIKDLYDLETVKITRYTNLYDKDKNGSFEKLLVYIQPTDRQGDAVKASGFADVELWNLEKKDKAMLGEWHIGPEELRDLWFATVFTSSYRLVFDVSAIISQYKEPLIVKITFTDYLSGKVFKEEKIIKPLE